MNYKRCFDTHLFNPCLHEEEGVGAWYVLYVWSSCYMCMERIWYILWRN